MAYNSETHHRRSIRLKGYDYAQPGAYFVTLVTHQREELFGVVQLGQILLTTLGKIVQAEWFHSAEIRKEIRLYADEFVIMPNHIHGIVWIVEEGADPAPLRGDPNDPGIVGAEGFRPGLCEDEYRRDLTGAQTLRPYAGTQLPSHRRGELPPRVMRGRHIVAF